VSIEALFAWVEVDDVDTDSVDGWEVLEEREESVDAGEGGDGKDDDGQRVIVMIPSASRPCRVFRTLSARGVVGKMNSARKSCRDVR